MSQPPKGYKKADLNDKQLAFVSRVANFVFLMHFDQLPPSRSMTGNFATVDALVYELTFTAEQVPDTDGSKKDYWCEVTFTTYKHLAGCTFSFDYFHVRKGS